MSHSVPEVETAEQTVTLMDSEGAKGVGSTLARWNLGALMVDVTFYSLAVAFLDPVAVTPLLLRRLGASGVEIGAFAALTALAFNLPQLAVAYRTHGRVRQKPVLSRAALATRTPIVLIPLAIARANISATAHCFALIATIGITAIWSCGDGIGYVPWMEIIARSFDARMRGRFFAISQVCSGVISVLVGAVVVRTVLSSLPFPRNYALLAAMAAGCVLLSMAGVLSLREPPAPSGNAGDAGRPPLAEYVRRLPALLRGNPAFRRLAAIQLLIGFGIAASRFYVIWAARRFRLADEWGGIYQGMQALGVVILMPALTYVSERRSAAAGVRLVALIAFLTPVVALTVGTLSPWLFGLVYFLMGGSLGWGIWIAVNHYLLSHVADDERQIFVALINLMVAPAALFPVLGGLMFPNGRAIELFGAPALFMLTAVVVGAGLIVAMKLPHPDDRDADTIRTV